jgi:diguanylate cyclase (GGDEF)-like protein/PAS domain S-box-containing protein
LTFELAFFIAVSAIGACIAALIAGVAWRRKEIPGGKSLSLMMAASFIWAGGAAFEHATIGIPGQIFWSKIEYFGVVSCPVFLLTFALEYNHLNQYLTRRNILLLFIIPFITLLLAFTNEMHGLIWTSFTASPAGENLTIFGHGFWFWVGAVGYSYIIMLAGTILLIRGSLGLPAPYRRQVTLIIIASITPWVFNIIYVTGLSPIPGLELTPLVIVLTGAILALAIFQFHLLDFGPIARHMLVEAMDEGILVVDLQNHVVDANPAVQRLLGENTTIKIGGHVDEIFNIWPEIRDLFTQNRPQNRVEISIEDTNNNIIEINLSPVLDRRGRVAGQFIVLRDITEKRRIHNEVERMNEYLRLQLAEIETLQASLRERAIRDALTGLYNRRYLDESMDRELSRAQRDHYEVSILMIDIDQFKQLNDTYGHKAGDLVLKCLANFLQSTVRQGDIVCRYAGDEFVIIMPSVHFPDAQNRAHKMCSSYNKLSVPYENMELHTTISIGVATYPQQGRTSDEIIRAADSAMYAAKHATVKKISSLS